MPVGDRRRHAAGRAEPHRPRRCCPRASGSATTTPASSRSRATWPPRAATSCWCRKDLPLRVKASAVGLTAEEYRAELAVESRLDRDGRAGRAGRRRGPALRRGAHRAGGRARAALPHRRWSCSPSGAARWPGSPPDKASGWCAATARRSACTAAAPSSGSPSTCCSTPSVGIVSLGGRAGTGKSRARAVRRTRGGARAAASTARSSCSVRCTPSAGRSSATCRAPRPRR